LNEKRMRRRGLKNSRFGHGSKSSDPLPRHEMIHHVGTHVRSVVEELEEGVIVRGGESGLDLESMLDAGGFALLRSKMSEEKVEFWKRGRHKTN